MPAVAAAQPLIGFSVDHNDLSPRVDRRSGAPNLDTVMTLPSPFFRTGRRAARSRGQAMVEFALVAPFIAMFVLIVVSMWLYYQKAATFTYASQTLAEWVARSGTYTPQMGVEIKNMLDDAIGVSSAESYLTIIILDAEPGVGGSVVASTGVTVPPDAAGGSPGDTGWDGTITNVIAGSFIQVDIWGYHSIGANSLGVAANFVPNGHAVMRSMWVLP